MQSMTHKTVQRVKGVRVGRARVVRPRCADFPKPKNIDKTENYRVARELSRKRASSKSKDAFSRKKVAIIGGGLSGLACGKYLSDAGHEVKRVRKKKEMKR